MYFIVIKIGSHTFCLYRIRDHISSPPSLPSATPVGPDNYSHLGTDFLSRRKPRGSCVKDVDEWSDDSRHLNVSLYYSNSLCSDSGITRL